MIHLNLDEGNRSCSGVRAVKASSCIGKSIDKTERCDVRDDSVKHNLLYRQRVKNWETLVRLHDLPTRLCSNIVVAVADRRSLPPARSFSLTFRYSLDSTSEALRPRWVGSLGRRDTRCPVLCVSVRSMLLSKIVHVFMGQTEKI